MTTPPAMPELPEPSGVIVVDTQALRAFTADQMRAYALATLQAQPAEVSDAAVWELWLRVCAESDNLSTRVMIANFARAILALRPQAVPMTRASRDEIMAVRTADGDADEWPEPWAYRRGWEDAEAHHRIGITAHAGGEVG